MIRPLRRGHDAVFLMLAVALPVFLIAAILARPAAPASWAGEVPAVLSASETAGTTALDLLIGELPNSPALLLYWAPRLTTTPGMERMLPADAVLLGSPRSNSTARYTLPAQARIGSDTDRGVLLLYSLGHQALVGDPVPLDSAALNAPTLLGEHTDGSASR